MDPMFERIATPLRNGIPNKKLSEQKRILAYLYKLVAKSGGFERVTGKHEWGVIATKVGYPWIKEAIDDYITFFFFYEKIKEENFYSKVSKSRDNLSVEDLNPNCLLEVPYFKELSSVQEIRMNQWKVILESEVFWVRNFTKAIKLDHKIFKVESIYPLFKNDNIYVSVQDPVFSGVVKTRLAKGEWSLQDYLVDLNRVMNIPITEDSKIRCGINFDISPSIFLMQDLIAKIPEEISFKYEKNILQSNRQHVVGWTLPQMFFHPKGSWIGGHQQPVGLRQAMINHGPGEIEWNIITSENIAKLEKICFEKYSIDIHKNEGLWYIETDLLLAHNIPVNYLVQKEGDLVTLAPGALAMRKANDLCYQTSWNFGTQDVWQLEAGFKKVKMDIARHLTSPIAWFTCVMDSVNQNIENYGPEELEIVHKNFTEKNCDEENVLVQFLKLFYIKDKKIPSVEKMKKLFTQEPKDSNIQFCTRCAQEIFNHWIIVPIVDDGSPHYFWISWALRRVDFLRNNEDESKFYYKYEDKYIQEFMKRIMRRMRDSNWRDDGEIKELSTFKKPLEYPDIATKELNEEDSLRPDITFKRETPLTEEAGKKDPEAIEEKTDVQDEKTEKVEEPVNEKKEEASGWGDAGGEDEADWNMPAIVAPQEPAKNGWEDYISENKNKKEEEKRKEEETTESSSTEMKEKKKITYYVNKDITKSLSSLVKEIREEENEEKEVNKEKEDNKVEEEENNVEKEENKVEKQENEVSEEENKKDNIDESLNRKNSTPKRTSQSNENQKSQEISKINSSQEKTKSNSKNEEEIKIDSINKIKELQKAVVKMRSPDPRLNRQGIKELRVWTKYSFTKEEASECSSLIPLVMKIMNRRGILKNYRSCLNVIYKNLTKNYVPEEKEDHSNEEPQESSQNEGEDGKNKTEQEKEPQNEQRLVTSDPENQSQKGLSPEISAAG